MDNEDSEYNSSENEAVDYEDENNGGQSYSRSTKKPLKSTKEQRKGSIDLKLAVGEVVTSALEYFKIKQGKATVDVDSTFVHVANSLWAVKYVHMKEHMKFKSQGILSQSSSGAQGNRAYNSGLPYTKYLQFA